MSHNPSYFRRRKIVRALTKKVVTKKTSDGLGVHCVCRTLYASTVMARTMGIARSSPSLVSGHIYSDVRGVRIQERRRNGEKKYTHDTYTHTQIRERTTRITLQPTLTLGTRKRPCCISGMPLSSSFSSYFSSSSFS